ncbi:MAG: hypothetical protein PHC47_02555 [Clostridia bacterium]|nr:hypothetical protein [Clostridia bacterium]
MGYPEVIGHAKVTREEKEKAKKEIMKVMKEREEANSEYERFLQELNTKLEKCNKLDKNVLNK